MAKSNFPKILDEVYLHEGGYVDHPRDPGGATNLGITHKTLADWLGRPVTKDDVRNITREQSEAIYRENYWDKVKGDNLPYGLDLVAMDGAVNSGPSRGAKWLQKGLGVKADGRIGPQTIAASWVAEVSSIELSCDARMSFLRGLRHWDAFGRGWSRRVASVEAVGVRMWLAAAGSRKDAVTGLQERIDSAPRLASDERRAGATQTTATATAGGGGVTVVDLPPLAIVALALGVAIAIALIYLRARRKAQYHEDRAAALETQKELLL
jgi:lysozyme family protein